MKDLDIVEVSICMDDAEQFIHEYKGKRYLTVQVAKRQEPSQFGKTHTVYHWKPEPKIDVSAAAYNELVANPATRAVLDERIAANKAKRKAKK